MRPWASLVGWLGAVALGFALISFLIQLTAGSVGSELYFTLGNLVAGLALLGLAAAVSVETLRRRLSSGEARRVGYYGTSAVLGTALAIALLVIAMGVFSFPRTADRVHAQVSQRFGVALQKRWDWTEAKSNSLTSQSEKVLADLAQPLQVTGLYAQVAAGPARELLEKYQLAAPDKLRVEFIDPQGQPGRLRELGIASERLATGLLHVKLGSESTEVSDLTEQALTTAIVKLVRREKKKVYLLIGHNERPIEGDAGSAPEGFKFAADALANESYEVSPLLLASAADVPADAQVVILAGPTRPYHETEHAALQRYVERGGAIVVMLDPRAQTDVYPDLAKWGVAVGDDVIVDRLQGMFGRPTTPFAAEYADHDITRELRDATLFHTARSVKAAPDAKGSFTELVRTSEESWAETDFERLETTGEVEPDDKDLTGPVPLALAGEVTLGSGEGAQPARLVVFGDSDFATNQLLNEFRNRDLFLNAVNWALGDVEAISVRPGQPRASRLQLSTDQFLAIRYLSLFVLPELIAVLGVIAWWRRRRAPGR
jgi:ABC-type uncharacterized transport system involved in gliding motility auxiliary subunit